MRMRWTMVAVAMAIAVASGATAVAAAEERYEDAVGDALGDAPDIVAVTVGEWDDSPLLRISVAYGAERPFGTDMETYTDVVFIGMAAEPTVDERGILDSGNGFLTGTHGVTMEMQAEVGAHLVTPTGMLEEAVDLEIEGDTLVFTLDRRLLDDPEDLYIQVLSGVEREPEAVEDEGDTYPELDQPPAHYRLGDVTDPVASPSSAQLRGTTPDGLAAVCGPSCP